MIFMFSSRRSGIAARFSRQRLTGRSCRQIPLCAVAKNRGGKMEPTIKPVRNQSPFTCFCEEGTLSVISKLAHFDACFEITP
jgi:hypothetical protein